MRSLASKMVHPCKGGNVKIDSSPCTACAAETAEENGGTPGQHWGPKTEFREKELVVNVKSFRLKPGA